MKESDLKFFKVGSSDIHGKGLFARRSFRPGERLGAFAGVPAKRFGMHVVFIPVEEKVKWDGMLEKENGMWWKALKITNLFKYINHCSSPNCEARGEELYALKAIAAGDEILMHYGDAWVEEEET